MDKINSIYIILSKFKYIIVIGFVFVFLGVLDSNSFYRMMMLSYEAKDLQDEIDRYNRAYEADRQQLHDLEVNPMNIKRIARERYFMKADDEDIFVLSTDKKSGDNEK